jgi:stage III sporulation protein AE
MIFVLDCLSKLNPSVSFTGFSKFFKSLMKWLIGICVTVYGVFLTVQATSSSIFDGILFKTTKYVVGNSVPIVGGFLSGGFDMLTSAGHLIKSSVGTCGVILLLLQIIPSTLSLMALSLLLKGIGAIVQPLGEGEICGLLGDVSSDTEYLLAGLLLVGFLYILFMMLAVRSVTYFL